MDPSLTDLVLKPKSKKIARPPNAFMIFAREHRKSFASQNPNQNNKLISKMLGDAWKKVDFKTREMYFGKAKQLELLHKQRYPNYFYSPRIARMQKMKRSIRRARLRRNHVSEDEEEDTDVKPKISKDTVESASILQEENWTNEFFKEEPLSPEYVPNNPDYFKNSNDMKDPSDVSFHRPLLTQSSCRPSCPSSCSVSDDSYFDFYSKSHSTCSCSNCDKYWPNMSHPPKLEPYWNTCSRDYIKSRSFEPDGFPTFPAPAYPYYQTPMMMPQYGTSNFIQAPNYMRDANTFDNSVYGPSPWKQSCTFRPSLADGDSFYKSVDCYRRNDRKCCKNHALEHFVSHEHPTYSCGNKWSDGGRLRCEDFSGSISTESAKLDGISSLHSGCEENIQTNDFRLLDPVKNSQNEPTLSVNPHAFNDEIKDVHFIKDEKF